LKAAVAELPKVPRVFLVSDKTPDRIDSPEKLTSIASWATGIGPNKAILEKTPAIVEWAHAAKTDRDAMDVPCVAAREVRFGAGRDGVLPVHARVDALFTDNPDLFPRTK